MTPESPRNQSRAPRYDSEGFDPSHLRQGPGGMYYLPMTGELVTEAELKTIYHIASLYCMQTETPTATAIKWLTQSVVDRLNGLYETMQFWGANETDTGSTLMAGMAGVKWAVRYWLE